MNNATKPTIQRLLDLQMLTSKLAQVERKVYLPPQAEAAETDVDHSFSLAMLGWFLAPQFPHLDAHKVLQLCLAHDMVEAYCGDTFSFDDEAVAAQQAREEEALVTLKKEWVDFPSLLQALDEYETRATPEAHFVVALDRLQPVMMDYLGAGKTWRKFVITYDKLMAVKDSDLGSSEVAEYYGQLKKMLEADQELFSKA